MAEGLGGDVLAYVAEQGVGDDEGGAGEVVGADVGVDAAFEVAVAGEDADGDQLVVFYGVDDGVIQRAGVADAGSAAVAGGLEAERVQVGGEAGTVEVFGDDLAAGGEAGFDPGFRVQAEGAGLAGDQAGGDQDVGVGGVGAAGYGGDHHVTVADIIVAAGGWDAVGDVGGGDVLVGGEVLEEGGGGVTKGYAVLRAFWAGEAGTMVARSSSTVSVKTGSGVLASRNMPWARR